ncbi:hypothetical protein V6N13_040207 [Hibiscus sabdariffa]
MYQKRMIRVHDKKVRPREFREGDLVLKMILPIEKDSRGKWMPNWKGPYVVTKAFSGGALILAKIDGEELQNPSHKSSKVEIILTILRYEGMPHLGNPPHQWKHEESENHSRSGFRRVNCDESNFGLTSSDTNEQDRFDKAWHRLIVAFFETIRSLPLKLTNLVFEGSKPYSSQAPTVGSRCDPTVQISPWITRANPSSSTRDSLAPTRAALDLRCTPRAATWLDPGRSLEDADPTIDGHPREELPDVRLCHRSAPPPSSASSASIVRRKNKRFSN